MDTGSCTKEVDHKMSALPTITKEVDHKTVDAADANTGTLGGANDFFRFLHANYPEVVS
jgi:hypothetical protein